MSTIRIKGLVLWLLTAAFGGGGSLGMVGRVSAAVSDDAPEYRIAITPTQKNLGDLEPGEEYTGEFEIRNTGKQKFDYKVSFAPYSAVGVNYDADFATETQYTDIARWISVDQESGSLDSDGRVTLKYAVNVPSDAHGGAQAGSIMVTMVSLDENDGNIKTERQLGYLLYGNVNGQITKTGKVLENKVPSFLFNPPIVGTSLVENTGNVYTRATYKLQVFPLFSDEEVYTNEEKPEDNIIFPETKRYNEIKWEGAPQLGIFKVRQTVKIFDEESVTEKLVFLCPIWFLFVIILLIFLIIFWIVSRVIKRKREA